jgi:hypothetical protein
MKMTIIALVASVAATAFAQTQQNYCGTEKITEKNCKNIPNNRRKELGAKVQGGNPVAITNDSGLLKVYYTIGGSDLKSCDITTNVKSFKMSQNSQDLSTAYFIKENGDLFDVKMHGYVSKTECPKALKQNYSADLGISQSDNIVEYKLASNSQNKITMAARTRSNRVIYSTDKKISELGRYRTAKEAAYEMDRLLRTSRPVKN